MSLLAVSILIPKYLESTFATLPLQTRYITQNISLPCVTQIPTKSTSGKNWHSTTGMGLLHLVPQYGTSALSGWIVVSFLLLFCKDMLRGILWYCVAHQHRNLSGFMLMTEMVSLPCKSSFHIYEPLPDYRRQCPRILVVCSGEHAHPIPASTKTPPDVRSEILNMLYTTMIKDLADMTPRRFLRHPVAQAFIRRKVPFVKEPQLSDVHPSLNNADHLRAYITQAQQSMFPAGTGWEGKLSFASLAKIT